MKKTGSIILCFIMLLMVAAPVGAQPNLENVINLTESGVVTVGKIDAETNGDYPLNCALGASTDFFTTPFIVSDEDTGGYKVGDLRLIDYRLNAPSSGKYKVTVDAACQWSNSPETHKMGFYVNKILCSDDEKATLVLDQGKNFKTFDLFEIDLQKGINVVRLFTETNSGMFAIRNFTFEKVGESDKIAFLAADYDSYNGSKPSIWSPNEVLYANTKWTSDQPNYHKTVAEINANCSLRYSINVPKSGVYKLAGTVGSDGGTLSISIEGVNDPVLETVIETGGSNSAGRKYNDEIGYLTLSEGDKNLIISSVGKSFGFVDLTFSYVETVEVEKITTGDDEVSLVIPRGSDRFIIDCSRKINAETLNGIKLEKADGTEVMTSVTAENDKIYIDLSETLDFGASYTLIWGGFTCVGGTTVESSSITFMASDETDDKGNASIVKNDDKCGVTDRNATISAVMKGSEGKPISGRKYQISKIIKPDTSEVTSSLPNGISGENGEFTISYTFPTDGFGSGLYKFYLSGEYVTEPCEVELLYVTEADKNSILDELKTTESNTQVQSLLEDADTMLALDINPAADLSGLTDKLAFYEHFIGSSFTEIEDFKKTYNTNIVLETINQATSAEKISAVLEDSEKAALLELDTTKYELILEKKAEFLEAFLNAERVENLEEMKALYDELTNKFMLLENSITAPVYELNSENVKEGQDIVLKALFADEVQKVKQIVLYFEAENEEIDEDSVSFETDTDAETKINAENGKIKVELTFDETDEVSEIGSLSIVSEYESGDEVKFLSSCEVVYDVGSGYDLIHKLSEESVSVSIKKAGSGSSSGSSSRPSAGGGGGATAELPKETKEPDEQTEIENEIKTPFGDLDDADWAKESIAKLYVKGVVSGDGENFYPNRSVTRAEFTKMLVNSLGLLKNDVKCELGDISEDSWEYIYVASAVESGIVTGDENGNFNGNSEISREDMCVMLYRAWQIRNGGEYEKSESFADEGQISSYAKDAVYAMRAFGIINGVGDNNFAPKTTATRAMAAKVIAGFMEGMNL